LPLERLWLCRALWADGYPFDFALRQAQDLWLRIFEDSRPYPGRSPGKMTLPPVVQGLVCCRSARMVVSGVVGGRLGETSLPRAFARIYARAYGPFDRSCSLFNETQFVCVSREARSTFNGAKLVSNLLVVLLIDLGHA
jgi:hypothetical protein